MKEKEKRKKEVAVVLRGRRTAESAKAERQNEQAMSQQGHLQHIHAVGTVAIPVFFVCVLCAPTPEPTYLSH